MHPILFFQVNYPTPTPFPTPSSGLVLPELEADTWEAAKITLQFWQMLPPSVPIGIQVVILSVILIGIGSGVYFLVKNDFLGRNKS